MDLTHLAVREHGAVNETETDHMADKPQTPIEHFRAELAQAEEMISYNLDKITEANKSIGGYNVKIAHLKAALSALEAKEKSVS